MLGSAGGLLESGHERRTDERTPTDAAYADGIAAAYRTGRYADATGTPACPYPDGTPEHESWQEGFSHGTQDFLAAKELD